jgi:hypothetical protein
MKQEGELSEERSATQFRDQFFLHAVASQNPRLYHELYDEPDVPEEWEVPQTPEDLQSMINELMDVGVNLNVNPDDIVPPKPEGDLEARYGVQPAQNPWNV